MKITNNFINIANIKNPSFSASITQMPTKKEIERKTITNPEYFRVLHGIGKGNIRKTLKYNDGKLEIVEILSKDVKKYLSDDKGAIIPDRVKEFFFLYRYISQGLRNENQSDKDRYVSSLNRYKNVTVLGNTGKTSNEIVLGNMPQEMNSEQEFIDSIMRDLAPEQKQMLQSALLGILEQEEDKIPANTYNKVLRLFDMSKTKDGYNFSSINTKLELIDAIDELSSQYGKNYPIEKLYDEFLISARSDDGTIDFKLINDTFEIIYLSGLVHSPKYIMDLFKKYTSKNPHNKDAITETMKKLNKTDFIMDSNESDFEDLMDLCFKGFHFSQKRADKLIELANYSKKWISLQQTKKEYSGIDRAISRYDIYVSYCKNLIMEYFSEYMDDKDNKNIKEISAEEYFALKTKGMQFI